MNSKMTEKEFRKQMNELVVAGESPYAAAREVAMRAGLEFAPEPVKLPEKLWRDGDMNTRFNDEPGYLAALPHDGKKALLDEQYARYNAYPGLRRAAERLIETAELLLAPQSRVHLGSAISALEAELAKGPK